MARIAGVDLPRDKRVEIGLTYIFGIGLKTAQETLKATGINPDTRVKDLTEQEVNKLREYIEHNLKVAFEKCVIDETLYPVYCRRTQCCPVVSCRFQVIDDFWS